MKIHDKLWYIINPSREENLAYMTYWEDNSACLKRMATGLSWAAGRYHSNSKTAHPVPVGVQIDNSPLSGFNIGSSVSRWSTENKVFRVTDPRGFTVEVPTDNIATLLHLTDVHKGVIQQECIWARDGNNHVLLPVNSEPYLATLKDMNTLDNIIDIKDLKLWDRIKLYKTDSWRNIDEYIYIGQYKVSWNCWWGTTRWLGHDKIPCYENKVEKSFGVYKDPKWQHYFLYVSEGKPHITYLTSPKIVSAVAGEDSSALIQQCLDLGVKALYVPSRVESLVPVDRKRSYWGDSNRLCCEFHSLGERRK